MVKKITLSNKDLVLVDNDDYKWLNEYNWFVGNGYPQTKIKINGKHINKYMHRLIINAPKGMEIDHIDNNILNNQKSNLRIVTSQQNSMNSSKIKKETSSKFKGVSWRKNRKHWHTYININKKRIYIGSFKNEIDAAKAYNKMAIKLFSEYAKLNEV